jgi:hypothetical protein
VTTFQAFKAQAGDGASVISHKNGRAGLGHGKAAHGVGECYHDGGLTTGQVPRPEGVVTGPGNEDVRFDDGETPYPVFVTSEGSCFEARRKSPDPD